MNEVDKRELEGGLLIQEEKTMSEKMSPKVDQKKDKDEGVSAKPLLRYLKKEIKMFMAATLFMVGSNIG